MSVVCTSIETQDGKIDKPAIISGIHSIQGDLDDFKSMWVLSDMKEFIPIPSFVSIAFSNFIISFLSDDLSVSNEISNLNK